MKCIIGGAILLMWSGPYTLVHHVESPAICQEIARDLTPFAVRFHFETPRCLMEIPAIKGDKYVD